MTADREAAHEWATEILADKQADAFNSNLASAYLEVEAELSTEKQAHKEDNDKWAELDRTTQSAFERELARAEAAESALDAERTAREQETAAYMDLLGKSQEPVAWKVLHTYRGITVRFFTDDISQYSGRENYEIIPLYTAPQDAKAIRAATLEEAAKLCDSMVIGGRTWNHEQEVAAKTLFAAAAAIRALK